MDKVGRPVFLLTDFGTRDHYVGQVRAVIAALAPSAPIHDLTHEVEPFAIDEGAWMLETSLPSLPADAVVMAVVDPGVGTSRPAVIVQRDGRSFVGPDNGLLSPAFSIHERRAAAVEARTAIFEIAPPARHASATFHGRDFFAPAAARIAAGADASELGSPTARAVLLPPFEGTPIPAGFEGLVIHIDRYGNIVTTVTAEQAGARYTARVADHEVEGPVRTFGDAGRGTLLSHIDSSGFIAVAMNQGNAAVALGVSRGEPVTVVLR